MRENTTIEDIHAFTGHPGKFWPAFLAFACRQADADGCILIEKKPSGWKRLYHWPTDQHPNFSPESISDKFGDIADACIEKGGTFTSNDIFPGSVALALPLGEKSNMPSGVIVFLIRGANAAHLDDILRRMSLISDAPAIYQRERDALQTQGNLSFFADVLDLLLIVNAEKRFLAAAMVLVNETVARCRCSRVSLGWHENGYVRLQTISHMERFERKMDIVACLEAAMEEAFDQDEEIVWPFPDHHGPVARDHGEYAGKQQVRHLVSIPLRAEDRPVAVLTCERESTPFVQNDVCNLRIICDQISPRLAELKKYDRWFGAKLKDGVRELFSVLFGVEHTLSKVMGLLICAFLVCLFIIDIPYRVEAPFILRSEDVRQVSAPFDGYIEDVRVKIGQNVEQNAPLLLLDTRDLLLEESEAVANRVRFLREEEKARAMNALTDMKIAQAKADQANARIELIRHHLSQALLQSPITGVIVEGDLEELRGAPVNKGDILFKVARHENLYAEMKIDERDIHELIQGQPGKIAFVSRPHVKYPFKLRQIDPVAIPGDSGNIFIARGETLEKPEKWWRPGMSGIAKIDVGRRRIIWIITHETVDFFRMLMWW